MQILKFNQGLAFCCYLSRTMFEALNNFPNVKLSYNDSLKIKHILKNNSCTMNTINSIFNENNLKMETVTVTSNYDGIVASRSGIDIILNDINIQILNDLYKIL